MRHLYSILALALTSALTVATTGCGGNSDPCAGQSGTCIGLRVLGSVPGLDQLAVTVDKPGTETQRTPVAPLTLPVKLPLLMPAGTTGSVHVTVDGLARGTPVARGNGVATLTAGAHVVVEVTLAALNGPPVDLAGTDASGDGGPGGGGSDLGGPIDMTGGCTPASCAPLHKDCDPVTLACVPCAAPPVTESRASFWVDSANKGSMTGSQGCPYSSITAGLAQANATSASFPIVHVVAGSYDAASGETFPLIVRKSISIAGAGAQMTVVRGDGTWSGTMFGSQANSSYHATMVVGSTGGTVSVSGLTLQPTAATPTATYVGVFCDEGNLPHTPILPANTTLSGLVIGPNYDTGVMVTNSFMPTDSACNLQILASTLSGGQDGVTMLGSGTVMAAGVSVQPVALTLGDGTAANGNTLANNHKLAGGSAVAGAGVLTLDGIAAFTASQSKFVQNDYGANFNHTSVNTNSRVALDFESNSFTDNSLAGIYVQNDEYLVLNNNSFTANLGTAANPGIGVQADGGSNVKARGNSFIGNDIGVNITGNGMNATNRPQVDFGLAADAGNNVFSCNSLAPHDYDVLVNLFTSDTTPMTFAGNTWDHMPPTTGASGAADGTDLVDAPLSGTAPVIDFSNSKAARTAACPAGRIH